MSVPHESNVNADRLSEAIEIWVGPVPNVGYDAEAALIERLGRAEASELIPIIRALQHEFYATNASDIADNLAPASTNSGVQSMKAPARPGGCAALPRPGSSRLQPAPAVAFTLNRNTLVSEHRAAGTQRIRPFTRSLPSARQDSTRRPYLSQRL